MLRGKVHVAALGAVAAAALGACGSEDEGNGGSTGGTGGMSTGDGCDETVVFTDCSDVTSQELLCPVPGVTASDSAVCDASVDLRSDPDNCMVCGHSC